MLQAFPGLLGKQRASNNRGSSVTYTSTAIPAGSSAGALGNWTQVIASTPFDGTAIRIWNTGSTANSGARGDFYISVGIGTAGNEVQKVGPLLWGGRVPYNSYTLPIFIPAGSRISLRSAAGVGLRSVNFSVDILGCPNRHLSSLPTAWVAYGMTSGAYGTIITPGATNTFGAWTLITATTLSHDLFLPMVSIGSAIAMTAVSYRTQVAIASTTQAATMVTNGTGVFEAPWLTANVSEQLGSYPGAGPIVHSTDDIIYSPCTIGQALSARAMCSGTPDTNGLSVAMLAAVK